MIMIIRTIVCDICKTTGQESKPNAGWPGWGSLHGITLNGTDNPTLCPYHLTRVADFIDKMIPNGLDES